MPAATIAAILYMMATMTDQELETVVSYVRDRLPELLAQAPTTIPNDYFRLTERIVLVEEALKNQNILMEKRFEAIDKRFEDLIHQMDKRFEDLIHQMEKRFEAIDKRFEAVDRRFEHMTKQAANYFGWTIGIMSTLFLALGALITIYRFVGIGG